MTCTISNVTNANYYQPYHRWQVEYAGRQRLSQEVFQNPSQGLAAYEG